MVKQINRLNIIKFAYNSITFFNIDSEREFQFHNETQSATPK